MTQKTCARRTRHAASTARPCRNARSLPSTPPCSVVLILPARRRPVARASCTSVPTTPIDRRRRRRRRRMMTQHVRAHATLATSRHQRDRTEILDRHLRRDRAPSSSSSPPAAVSARENRTSVPATPIDQAWRRTSAPSATRAVSQATRASRARSRARLRPKDKHELPRSHSW